MIERILRLPLMDDSPTARLFYGVDVREGLKLLPDSSVHMVCTSPPYWGLRDYGVEGQIGLEESPEEYVQNLVEVFHEVKRVLRPDGTLWLNLGDSYTRDGKCGRKKECRDWAQPETQPETRGHSKKISGDWKPKDLVGIPWLVAFALRAEGWYLRSDIVWAKLNPMPEPVYDRPTKAHEYIFYLRIPSWRGDTSTIDSQFKNLLRMRDKVEMAVLKPPFEIGGGRSDGLTKPNGIDPSHNGGRNKRSVWTINPKPYKGAHFATWPPDLVETMVKAGTSARGVCSKCGAPLPREEVEAACACENAETGRATVLDPFSGSATTGYVALRLGRNYIGLDLNSEYLALAETRVLGEAPLDKDPEMRAEGSALDLFGERS